MKAGARVAATIELREKLCEIRQDGKRTPADMVVRDYYKERRFIGSQDRREISRLVYLILRNESLITWWLEQDDKTCSAREMVLCGLVFLENLDLPEVRELFSGEKYCPPKLDSMEREWVLAHAGKPLQHEAMPDWVRLNFPEWMQPTLQELFGDQLTEALEALNDEAPVDVRVNTLKSNQDQVMAALREEGMDPEPTPFAVTGVRLRKRAALSATQAFRDGWFELQDEGSQLAAELVRAQAGEKVIDYCAGAGGKTLSMAAAMQNQGHILAWDTKPARLKQMLPRLARAGVSNVQSRLLKPKRDSFVERHKNTADWVLADVPCSGTGTWRRNPDLKWRTEPSDLERAIDLQCRIMEHAACCLKPGGRLVYVTCSILEQENERQVAQFLETNPKFSVEPIANSVGVEGPYLRLYPHLHQTDGFFGAVLRRRPEV
jgi:16S rRNA (cytosine967-C5)-methyltransferase